MKYVGLYNDGKDIATKANVDAVSARVDTNEDNIAMIDSDVGELQTDVSTLQGNVTTLTNALSGKQDAVTGAASTVVEDNLTASRVVVSNASGKIAVSDVTATELGYLDGVTSNIQTQLDGKLSSAPVTSVNTKTGAVVLGKADVGLGNVDNVKQYSADNPPPYPVTSVNGQTGTVTIDLSTYLALTGGTMSGVIDMNNNKITNVATPTADGDAANKQYVDANKGVEAALSTAQPSGQVEGDMWFQQET